jgi:hypothetical protein
MPNRETIVERVRKLRMRTPAAGASQAEAADAMAIAARLMLQHGLREEDVAGPAGSHGLVDRVVFSGAKLCPEAHFVGEIIEEFFFARCFIGRQRRARMVRMVVVAAPGRLDLACWAWEYLAATYRRLWGQLCRGAGRVDAGTRGRGDAQRWPGRGVVETPPPAMWGGEPNWTAPRPPASTPPRRPASASVLVSASGRTRVSASSAAFGPGAKSSYYLGLTVGLLDRLRSERRAAMKADARGTTCRVSDPEGTRQDAASTLVGQIIVAETNLSRAVAAQYHVSGKAKNPRSWPRHKGLELAGLIDSAQIAMHKPLAGA